MPSSISPGRSRPVDARLFAPKAPPDPRDAAAALFKFESGATGTMATVRAAPMYWRIMVFGTKGWAEAREETTLTVAKVGEQPVTQVYPAVDSLGVLLEAFGETHRDRQAVSGLDRRHARRRRRLRGGHPLDRGRPPMPLLIPRER